MDLIQDVTPARFWANTQLRLPSSIHEKVAFHLRRGSLKLILDPFRAELQKNLIYHRILLDFEFIHPCFVLWWY